MAVEKTNYQLGHIPPSLRLVPVCRRNNCHYNDGTKLSLERNGDGIWAFKSSSGHL